MTGISGRGAKAAAITTLLAIVSATLAAPEPARAAPPAPAPKPRLLSAEQAVQQARLTGKAVEATQATTETDTLVAKPDGLMTLTRTAVPVRTRVDGKWQALDPTLVRNSDGTWSPRVSSARLTLSGGGSGPMAQMEHGGLTAGVVPPAPLPEPRVAGDTATYAGVLPGVDLRVTAKADGGFAEVLVVHDATAARHKDLATLLLPTKLSGLKLSADAAGNITGRDRTGGAVLTSPTPLMWDSTAPADAGKRTATAAASTFRGPGAGARRAPVKVRTTAARIELTPDQALLTGAKTRYPVYIDPTFTWASVGARNNGWATLPKDFPTTNYWKRTPDPYGRMQVGNPNNEITSRTFINFPIAASTLSGASINTATLKITQTRSWSCDPSRINLYAPGTTLTSGNATWNFWKDRSLGSVVDSRNEAHGYSGCPADAISFDIKSAVTADVAANKTTQTFALVAADEDSDNGWKEFLETSPSIEITYNHKPNKPTGMTTSPPTSCGAATPSIVGDGDVILYAPVSDRNGSVLGVTFNLWKTPASATIIASSNPNLLTYRSGTTSVLRIPVATLRAAAGGVITQFSWKVRSTDFNLSSDWSNTCTFKFDPTRTGPPVVVPPADSTIGATVEIPVAKPPTGTVPTTYLYQLNGGPFGKITATDGAATVSVSPSRFTNSVTVTGLSPGGNIGDTATVTFNSDPAERAMESDFDGDDIADLVTAGGQHNLAPGLWLAAGEDAGKIAPAATNIGARGNGVFDKNPADFTGAQIVAGRFGGTGFQDVLAYYPQGAHAGMAVILRGNGDGSPIQSQLDGTYEGVNAGTFWDYNGLDPRQLVNAGHRVDNARPDLLGITGNEATGYYLNHYPDMGYIGGYGMVNSLPAQTTPTGGLDWDTWTLASVPNAAGVATVFLWQKTTGKLYVWRDLTFDANNGTLVFQQQLLSNSWNAGQDITPYAADADDDGRADLWSIGANATAAVALVGDIGLVAGPAQTVLTASHAWLLNDAEDGPVTGTTIGKDSTGTLPVTGSGKAAWNTGDLFDPDVKLDGTNSLLSTAGPAVRTDADFTVSAWVKPDRLSGTVLSQDSSVTSAFRLWIEPSDASWRFSMAASNATSPTWATAIARKGSAVAGVWTHVSASYQRSTGNIDLHVNGKDAGSAVHPTAWNASGVFRIGAHGSTNTATAAGFLQGQVAEVHTYNSVVIYDDGNPRIRDFNGDNRTDIIAAHTDGRLLLYRGNGAGNFRPGFATVGSGWNNANLIFSPGDFDGDGFNDLIARRPDGTLWLYRGNGAGTWINGGSPALIGSGWNSRTAVFSPGDFNGDGNPDVIARATDGILWLYRGNGTGGWLNGTDPDNVGSGFHNHARVFSPGDFNRDGFADIMAVSNANASVPGQLLLFRGNGRGGYQNGGSPDVVGRGWLDPTAIIAPGDFNGDGFADVITRRSDGELWLYRGNGNSGWLNGTAPNLIGKGWNSMTKIM